MYCRLRALYKELNHDWARLNLAAKVLVILGGFLFASIVFIAVYRGPSTVLTSKIEIIFRSAMASVFGYILSSNTKNVGIKNRDSNGLMRSRKEESKICSQDISEDDKYYYNEGNSVQILIALFTTVFSGLVIIYIYVNNLKFEEAIVSQFRDFMCTSIGFLIGESKIKEE